MRILLALHRYVALAALPLFVVVGVTGSALVLRAPFEDLMHPERRLGTPHSGVQYQKVLDAASARVPHASAWRINPPTDELRAAQVLAEGPAEVLLWVHPSTGAVISAGAVAAYPMDALLELHMELPAGPAGKIAMLVGGIAMLLMVPTGLLLWWPRKLKMAWRYRLSATGVGFHYELHRLTGILAMPALLAASATGVLLMYPEVTMHAIQGTSAPTARAKPPGRLPPAMDLDRIVAEAVRALPPGQVTRVVVPANGAAVVVRMKTRDEDHPNGLNIATVDPASASILSAVPATRAAASIRVWEVVYPLHIGSTYGAANRVVMFLAGLVPLLLGITGLRLWWRRRSKA